MTWGEGQARSPINLLNGQNDPRHGPTEGAMTTQGYRLGPQKGVSGGNPGVEEQMSLEDPRQTSGPQRWPGQDKVHRGTPNPLPPTGQECFQT